MNYKMIFLDIDGTLVNSKKEITEKTRSILQKKMQEGIIVCIASGRPFHVTIDFAENLGLFQYGGYICAHNGQKICDLGSGEDIFESFPSKIVCEKAYDFSKKNEMEFIAYCGDMILTENPLGKFVRIESRVNKIPIKGVESMLRIMQNRKIKFILAYDKSNIEEKASELSEIIGDDADIFRSQECFIDVLPKGINKASQCLKLAKSLGIDRSETIAFGDGYNDIKMIESAGIGVAMKNGIDEIKQKADYITKYTNEEDGIANFLEWFDKKI